MSVAFFSWACCTVSGAARLLVYVVFIGAGASSARPPADELLAVCGGVVFCLSLLLDSSTSASSWGSWVSSASGAWPACGITSTGPGSCEAIHFCFSCLQCTLRFKPWLAWSRFEHAGQPGVGGKSRALMTTPIGLVSSEGCETIAGAMSHGVAVSILMSLGCHLPSSSTAQRRSDRKHLTRPLTATRCSSLASVFPNQTPPSHLESNLEVRWAPRL
mmetsp:Transcript_60078/g.97250  ORF Transcript_60078/g.97250 Transcript_60078/m.97250 type:complete len:217 (+) Transcript_60078:1246-1896(+)